MFGNTIPAPVTGRRFLTRQDSDRNGHPQARTAKVGRRMYIIARRI